MSSLCFSCRDSLLFSMKVEQAFETAECMINGLCCGAREDVKNLTDAEVRWLVPAIAYIIENDSGKDKEAFHKAVQLVFMRMLRDPDMSFCGFKCLCALLSNQSAVRYHEDCASRIERQILEMAKLPVEQKKAMLDVLWNACREQQSVMLCRQIITAIQTVCMNLGNLEEIIQGVYHIKGYEKDFETFVYYSLDYLLRNKGDDAYIVEVFNILWSVVPKEKLLRIFIKVMDDTRQRAIVVVTHCETLIPVFAKFFFSGSDDYKKCFPNIVRLFIDNQDKKWDTVFYNFMYSRLHDQAAVALFFKDLNRLFVTRPMEMRNIITLLSRQELEAYDDNSLLLLANIRTVFGLKVKIDVRPGATSPLFIMLNQFSEAHKLTDIQQLQMLMLAAMCKPDDFDCLASHFNVVSEETALAFIELCPMVKMSRGIRKRLRSASNVVPDLAEIVRLSADFYPMNELRQVGDLPEDAVCYKTTDVLFVFHKTEDRKLILQIRTMVGVKEFEIDVEESLKDMPTSSLAPSMIVNFGLALPDNKCKLKKVDAKEKAIVNELDQTYLRIDFKVFVSGVHLDTTNICDSAGVSDAFWQFYSDLGFSKSPDGVAQSDGHFVRFTFELAHDKPQTDLHSYGTVVIFNQSNRPISTKHLDPKLDWIYSVSLVDNLYVITPLVVPEKYLSWPLGQSLIVHRHHLKFAIFSLLYFPTISKMKNVILGKYQARGVIWRELDRKCNDDIFQIVSH